MTWRRRLAQVLLAAYSVFLVVVLFSPTSERQSDAVVWLGRTLLSGGVPLEFMTYQRLEFLANIAIIAPFTFLASLVRPSMSWRDWTALVFVVAVSVELAQGLLLPNRQTAMSDVVANTAGALVGASLIGLIRPMLRRKTTA